MTDVIDNPDARPIACEHCAAVFFDVPSFNQHIALHQTGAGLADQPQRRDSGPCPECGREFFGSFAHAHMARHRHRLHGVEPAGKQKPRRPLPSERGDATQGEQRNQDVDALRKQVAALEAIVIKLDAALTEHQHAAPTPLGSPGAGPLDLQMDRLLQELQQRFAIHERRADAHQTPSTILGVH